MTKNDKKIYPINKATKEDERVKDTGATVTLDTSKTTEQLKDTTAEAAKEAEGRKIQAAAIIRQLKSAAMSFSANSTCVISVELRGQIIGILKRTFKIK